jgi:hypothetical protein
VSGVSGGTWDFFVSYTQADRAWAEWIAWALEEEGYRVLIQAWDFAPGTNWAHMMQAGTRGAKRTIAVLSDAYSESVYGGAEWQAAWIRDPLGADRKLLVVRVEECERPGLLAAIVGPDLFRLSEPEARDGLLKMAAAAVTGQRLKPPAAPGFPGANRTVSEVPRFPGDDAGREPHAPTAPGLGRRLFSARIGRHSGQLSVAFGADDTLVVVEKDTTVHRWSLGGTSRAR